MGSDVTATDPGHIEETDMVDATDTPIAMRCDSCERALPDGAPIWRVTCGYGRLKGESGNWMTASIPSVCGTCWTARWASSTYWQWRPEQPCAHCGRPVIRDTKHRVPMHIVCGDKCRVAFYNAQAGARRRERRQPAKRVCPSCGEAFVPKRADVRYCHGACKQRAYRLRQIAAAY